MRRAFALALLLLASAAHADDAVRFDLFASDDADDTWQLRTGATWLYRYDDPLRWRGLEGENLRLGVAGDAPVDRARLFYRFADHRDDWQWEGRVGSDGHTVLGNASLVRDVPRRQEYFLERDMVETRRGLDGLYYTYAGAAFDWPLGEADRQVATGLVGAQAFDDGNVRAHLRGRYVFVLAPEHGISAQLRVRAFHDSEPGRSDYFSPRWYVEALPMLQWRRFHEGWRWQAAAGVGRQREAGTNWRTAHQAEFSVTSPATNRDWQFRASALYSSAPTASGAAYGYRQLSLEFVKALP